jgi:hypothetical protein
MVFDGLMKRISAGSPALVHHSHSIDCNSLGIPKVIVFLFCAPHERFKNDLLIIK